jgi:hypothetical protein
VTLCAGGGLRHAPGGSAHVVVASLSRRRRPCHLPRLCRVAFGGHRWPVFHCRACVCARLPAASAARWRCRVGGAPGVVLMHRHPPPAPGLALLSARSALVGVLHNHTLLTHADLAACCDALSAVNAALGRPCGAVHKRLSSQIALDRHNGLLPGRSW